MKAVVERLRSLNTLMKLALAAGLLAVGAITVYVGASTFLPREDPSLRVSTEITSLYNVVKKPVRLSFRSNYGGIDELNGNLLVVDRHGEAWLLDDQFNAVKQDFQVPTNTGEYQNSAIPYAQLEPYRENWTARAAARFGVRDILVIEQAGKATLYAAYFYWYEEDQCLTVNVAALQLELPGGQTAHPESWQRLYESAPCLGLAEDSGYIWMEDGGGRLIQLDNGQLLLTVGDFGYDGMKSQGVLRPQLDDSDYGKTMLIDPVGGTSRVYTKGHRNPQGLVLTDTGKVYATEHGPVGGDELNLIEEGANYGWPLVSYGRTCIEAGSCADDDGLSGNSRLNWTIGEHAGDYELPIYSWVPSIGISNVISVRGTLFERWKGDLLVSSLKQKTLYRVRLRDGRVVLSEPILNVGQRIRDLIELSDGRVILKPDSNVLFVLEPDISPRANVVAQCSACHTFTRDGDHGIGPNLWNVMDRRIASGQGFEFSESLQMADSNWDRESLRHFLGNPQAFASGSTMAFGMQDPEEIDVAIDFLETLVD